MNNTSEMSSKDDDQGNHQSIASLGKALHETLNVSSSNDDCFNTNSTDAKMKNGRSVLICDAGYGLPREARPRKEKILAIARQLANFIQWQQQQQKQEEARNKESNNAEIRVVACADEDVRRALEERTWSLLQRSSEKKDSVDDNRTSNISNATNLSFSCASLESECSLLLQDYPMEENVVYLSPDADQSLDIATSSPPKIVVVGLLIDRRIQPLRSHQRASKVDLVLSKRWPLETCFQNISSNEPLNVDCIMEGMQQWWWNTDEMMRNMNDGCDGKGKLKEKEEQLIKLRRDTFIQAATQAIEHHARRHPSRPVHKTKG